MQQYQSLGSTPIHCSDQEAIQELYRKMAKPALNKTQSIVANTEIAREIVHDVFIKLWQNALTFPHQKAAYAWIYKSCHNAAIDHIRSAAHVNENTDLHEVENLVSTRIAVDEGVISRSELLRLVKELPPNEADVLVYTVLDEMSQEEICELMKISRRTVQRLWQSVNESLKRKQ